MDRLVNARALGVEDALADGNDEMPGDISINGDKQETHYHYAAPPTTQAPIATQPVAPQTPAPTASPQSNRWMIPLLACALGLPVGAAGGAALYQYLTKAPAAVQSLNNLGIKPGIHVSATP